MSSMYVFHADSEEIAICKAMLFVEMITVFPDVYANATVGIGDCIEAEPGQWAVGIGVGNTPQTRSLTPMFHAASCMGALDLDRIYFTPN